MPPAHDGDRGRARATAAGTTSTRARTPRRRPAPRGDRRTLDRRAGRVRRRRPRHPAAAAPDARRGPPAAALAAARLPLPHQLRVDPRRRSHPTPKVDYSQGVAITSSLPPRRAHPHRAGALRQGQQRDGAAADRARPTATVRAPRWQTWLKEMWQRARQRRSTCTTSGTGPSARSSRWSCRRSTTRSRCSPSAARLDRPLAPDLAAGSRRAQPDLDPGRPTRRSRKMAEIDRRHAGRLDRRALQPPADRALHRRLHDRRLDAQTGVIDPYQRVYGHPGLHVVDGVRDHRQPRREPVADDHRPGGAGDGVLAQQGRGRPAPAARARRTSGSRRSPPAAPGRPGAAPGALRLPDRRP